MDLEVVTRKAAVARGAPMVMVHGLSHGAWCWDNYMGYYSERGHDCYALSLRGHGKSEGREQLDELGFADYVQDILHVVSGLGEKPILIGHSMGGGIVQKFIGQHQDKVSAAVLLAPAVEGGMTPRYAIGRVGALDAVMVRGLWHLVRLIMGRGLSAAEVAVLPFFDGRLSLDEADKWRPLFQAESMKSLRNLMRPYTDEYEDVTIPVLVIGSKEDIFFGPKDLTRTAHAYGAEPIILPDMCHDMMLDPEWELGAEEILDFIDRVPTS